MRVLVTGAAGFMGGYLVRELLRAGHTVLALDAVPPPEGSDLRGGSSLSWQTADLLDGDALEGLLSSRRPDALVHLAAIASVPQAAAEVERAYRINVLGTLRLLRSFRRHACAARLLIVSSAQVYGNRARARPVPEDAVLEPDNIYAESKAWADFLALLHARLLGMAVITARPHNHTGPGQAPVYAVPAFARQVAALAWNRSAGPLTVGNLDSRRDLSDVRDVAVAYRLLLERGMPGRAYNIASGQLVSMREILTAFCKMAGVAPRIKVDRARWRPTDESPLLDTSAILRDTGWQPGIALSETLRAVWAATVKA